MYGPLRTESVINIQCAYLGPFEGYLRASKLPVAAVEGKRGQGEHETNRVKHNEIIACESSSSSAPPTEKVRRTFVCAGGQGYVVLFWTPQRALSSFVRS